MEFLRGRIFRDINLPNVHPDQRTAIYDAMNEALATLHCMQQQKKSSFYFSFQHFLSALNVKALGLGDYGKPGNYYARQLDRWAQQYEASKTGSMPDMDQLIAWLKTHVPPDDGVVTLTHGDFRLENILFHPTEPRILAVLDWELSTLGHPMSDLAYKYAFFFSVLRVCFVLILAF